MIVSHEMKQGGKSLCIWTLSISFFIVVCVLLYPQMKAQMEDVNQLFASMGSFSAAFGMDQLNFGTIIGFYAVECGNIIGIGGAFHASILGIQMVAKEEKNHTSEFLFSHPISRTKILWQKWLASMIQIFILNVITIICGIASMVYIKESIPWKELCLIHLAYYFLQVELCWICFSLSCFIRNNGMGLGIGLASIFYFLNIVANISSHVEKIKQFTPFGYADAADIVARQNLDWINIGIHLLVSFSLILMGWLYYSHKNIQN